MGQSSIELELGPNARNRRNSQVAYEEYRVGMIKIIYSTPETLCKIKTNHSVLTRTGIKGQGTITP